MAKKSLLNLKSLLVWGVGSLLGVTLILGFVAMPIRTWNAQTSQREAAQVEMAELTDDIERLNEELKQLQSDAEIERRAREDFGLVRPGQESYRVVEISEAE